MYNWVMAKVFTQAEKDEIVHKLEPYLKIGLSVRKACLEAKIPKSHVYDLMNEEEDFMDRIVTCQNYMSVLVSDILMADVLRISADVKNNKRLLKEDAERVHWVALNSNLLKEEFSERKNVEVIDPQAELKKIMALVGIEQKEDATVPTTSN